MGRKVLKQNLLKCKGHNVAPCFDCKRKDPTAAALLTPVIRNHRGINYCEHIIHRNG